MVKVIDSLLTDLDIEVYTDLINSKEVTYNTIGSNNYYNRFIINDGDGKDTLIKKLISNRILNNDLNLASVWLNKVTPDSNTNDVFHIDSEDLTIIVYLNDDFIGGEFEYIENTTTYKIQPKKGLTLRLDNKVEHRVLPVIDGVRYSLVIFIKKKKTLL